MIPDGYFKKVVDCIVIQNDFNDRIRDSIINCIMNNIVNRNFNQIRFRLSMNH